MTVERESPSGTPAIAAGAAWPLAGWAGDAAALSFDAQGARACLERLDRPCFVVRQGEQVGITSAGAIGPLRPLGGAEVLAQLGPLTPAQLGDPAFRVAHGVSYAYMGGAMANGIASEELVIALGRAGLLGSFGAAGLPAARVEAAISSIQSALPRGPYAFNLIHSPHEEALERRGVELYLQHGVRTVEASAFLRLTPNIVRYRVAGLSCDSTGRIVARNRVIAKVSRHEVAEQFLGPPPPALLAQLLSDGLISEEQARLAAHVPMADDLTVEADSGGHTDNRPLVCLLPAMLALRDAVQARERYGEPVRVGAGGGIGTPSAALAAFMMGAAYVVIGSVNQACLQSGASPHTRRLLAEAEMVDVVMAPAADMFEMGVRVQVLKRGTLFAMRAQKLFELYRAYDGIEAIPADERRQVEREIFRADLDAIWQECETFFRERDPQQLTRAAGNPRRKMALVFRWYLGLASRWSNRGEPGRESDYQIWCGPAMGAFNGWARGSYLERPEQRSAPDVALQLLTGAAYLSRAQLLRAQGVQLAPELLTYVPRSSLTQSRQDAEKQ